MMTNDDRRMRLGRAHNMRDMGGLPTTDGRLTRSGVLFRSDSLHQADPEDVALLAERLRVRRLIDLRSSEEAEQEPPHDLIARGVRVESLPIARGAGRAIVAGDDEAMLAHRYLEYVEDHGPELAQALRLISEAPQTHTIFHCRLGKDRTGVVAALVLRLLGVPDDAIVADYVVTNENLELLIDALRSSPIYGENVRRLPPEMYTSRAETMETFLQLLDERYGSARSWALSVGLSEDEIEALHTNLTIDVHETGQQTND
jgi:protein-tyrosine phosphatase